MLITYNHERYIAQALDSVLAQKTNFDFEINVIEDCSTDRTADIILDYAARYPNVVKPFLNNKNIGCKVTQKNFVRGFRTLKGEYIAILEGDDYWTSSEKLQKQVEFLDSHADFTVCAHNTIKMYDDNSQPAHRFLYSGDRGDGKVDDAIALRMFFHTTGVLYRNVFDGNPPKQYISPWSCDIFILISHAAHGRIHHMDEDMAVYRAHAGGRFSTLTPLAGWKFNIGGLQRYNAWLKFRFMRPFAKTIASYCEKILAQSGKDGVESLNITEWIKYYIIMKTYSCVYIALSAPNIVARVFLKAAFSRWWSRLERRSGPKPSPDRLEEAGIQEGQAHTQADASSRTTRSTVSTIRRVFKIKMSDVRLPTIASFGPTSVGQGEAFNVQADGNSAIWISLDDRSPSHAVLIFGGVELTPVVNGKIVTAIVPSRLTARRGAIPIWLEANEADGIRISDPVYFHVV